MDKNPFNLKKREEKPEGFLDTDEFGIDDAFYRVFAVYKKNYFRTRKAIGDYYDVKEAMSCIEELTGNPVHIYSF